MAISAWFLCSFGRPSRSLVAYHLKRGGMPLHYAFGVNFQTGATTDIHGIWAKGCDILDN